MSGTEPAAPQRRELEIMRVLFERRLKDRAIALSDSRWPGSGKMVDLAYEWSQLNPGERRDRLNAIGPPEIARLREFTELNPDLAKAVDELDRRGVLPQLETIAVDYAAAFREAEQQNTTVAPPSPTSQDQSGTTGPATSGPEAAPDAVDVPEPEVAEPVIVEPEYDFEDLGVDKLNVDMPDLDLGLPTTTEFLSSEEDRRKQAALAANESMERVRRSLDQAMQRAFDRSAAMGVPKVPAISRPTLPSVDLRTDAQPTSDPTVQAIDAPASLARHLERNVVATIRTDDPVPGIDQLVSLANDLQLGFTEHKVEFGNRRDVFGGLVAEFGRIRVKPGSIPKAIAAPNLVVIYGRFPPQLIERIEDGFFDIPGTRASVRVHPKARVVVLNAR